MMHGAGEQDSLIELKPPGKPPLTVLGVAAVAWGVAVLALSTYGMLLALSDSQRHPWAQRLGTLGIVWWVVLAAAPAFTLHVLGRLRAPPDRSRTAGRRPS